MQDLNKLRFIIDAIVNGPESLKTFNAALQMFKEKKTFKQPLNQAIHNWTLMNPYWNGYEFTPQQRAELSKQVAEFLE